jgi:hypothetical protein
VVKDPGGPTVSVSPSDLLSASRALCSLAAGMDDRTRPFAGQVSSAQSSLDAVVAGGGWSELASAWGAALARLQEAVAAYGSNTAAAAVAYQDADLRAMPPAPAVRQPPPPPPSPPWTPLDPNARPPVA